MRSSIALLFAAALLLCSACSSPQLDSPPELGSRSDELILAKPGTSLPSMERHEELGTSLDLSGDLLAVGAPTGMGPNGSGAVYLFGRNQGGADNWGLVKKIDRPTSATGDFFGRKVALSGDVLVAMTTTASYVFERDLGGAGSWGFSAQILGGSSCSVDAYGDFIVVGDPNGTDLFRGKTGRYHLFKRPTWGQAHTWWGGGFDGDRFGEAVSIFGDYLLIGEPGRDYGSLTNQGSAQMFRATAPNWSTVVTRAMTMVSPYSSEQGGTSVATDGNVAALGASNAVQFHFRGTGDTWTRAAQKLPAPVSGTRFGRSLAISGGLAVIGADQETGGQVNSGAVYVYRVDPAAPTGVVLIKRLVPLNSIRGERYGSSVAVSGTDLAVGIPFSARVVEASGAAQVLGRDVGGTNNLGEVALVGPDEGYKLNPTQSMYGEAVAAEGDTLLVGARNDRSGGSISLFQRNQANPKLWDLLGKRLPPPNDNVFGFGRAVALSSDTALVSTTSSAVYVLGRNVGGANGWGVVRTLKPPTVVAGSDFGVRVALEGDTAAIAAGVGVYLFERNQGGADAWGLVLYMNTARGGTLAVYGASVDFSGDELLVGAPNASNGSVLSGAAILFSRNKGGTNNWGWVKNLFGPGGTAGDHFGESVAIDGNVIAVGAPDRFQWGRGEAYVFERDAGGVGNWGHVKSLSRTDLYGMVSFGKTLALRNELLIVGAPLATYSYGFVQLYARGTGNWYGVWAPQLAERPVGSSMGSAVALSGSQAFVGLSLYAQPATSFRPGLVNVYDVDSVDDCVPGPCLNGGTCVDQFEAYSCNCPSAWTGPQCQDVNDCYPNPCVNGSCADGVGTYTCSCSPGWTGANCDVDINECQPNPCQNSGACTDGINSYTCACVPGWLGPTCTNLDECFVEPCQNNGVCIEGNNTYVCVCPSGFSGVNCETNINECAANPCLNGGTCIDGVASYTCQCQPGYSGSSCQTNINDCNPNPCLNGGACTDGVASFTCNCANTGFSGATCQTNVDDCPGNVCLNGAACVDGVNSYTCSCQAGFTGQYCATNIDDCTPNPCLNGATCQDGVASYTCQCPAGYQGARCELEINECAAAPCQNGGTCIDQLGTFSCVCPSGFAGPTCAVNIDDCVGNACLNGGSCVDGIASYTCACPAGFAGAQCQTNIDECAAAPCLNGGVCQDGVNSYSCTCPAGFSGATCAVNIDDCVGNACLNGGTCVDGLASYSCTCPAGFTGAQCQTNVDECAAAPCLNGGVCLDGNNSFSCTCPAGYSGSTCAVDIDECAGSPCLNGGSCVDGLASYTCACPSGFTGAQCQTNVDECAGAPCLNGGSCVDGLGSYSCNCPSGYSGVNCETRDPAAPSTPEEPPPTVKSPGCASTGGAGSPIALLLVLFAAAGVRRSAQRRLRIG